MRQRLKDIARWSERYTKTDMLYLLYSGFWSNINAIIISALSLALYVAYAHFLTKEAYGTYQYLLSFFSIATAFTLTGMNVAVTRAVAQGSEGTLRASVRAQLLWGLIPFFGSLAAALYYLWQGNMLIAGGLVFIAIGTPLLYAYNTYGALFAGRKNFKGLTLYNSASNIIYYAALIAAAVWSHSPLIILAANMLVQSALAFVFYRLTLVRQKPNHTVDESALSYGVHLSFMNVFGSVAGQLGNIFIFHFLGAPALALYSFASAMPERIGNICFKFLGSALLPKFSERTLAEIRRELPRKIVFATATGALVAGGYMVVAAPLFYLFFPTYTEAIPYSLAIALGLIIGAAVYLPVTALTALKKTRSLYILNTLNPIAQIAFPLIGIYFGGLWGYLIANLCTTLFGLSAATILVYTARD